MSACRCPHCSATGRCNCLTCMEAEHGTHYVNQYRMNLAVAKGIKMGMDANGGQFPLIGLFFLPRLLAAAKQEEETYRCATCNGKGFNYIGRPR